MNIVIITQYTDQRELGIFANGLLHEVTRVQPSFTESSTSLKMADLDVTAGVNATVDQPPAEEDPAAEFLAREQTELAGLEDENVAGQTAETGNYLTRHVSINQHRICVDISTHES